MSKPEMAEMPQHEQSSQQTDGVGVTLARAIVLNGASSSGKTSIAQRLQEILRPTYLSFSAYWNFSFGAQDALCHAQLLRKPCGDLTRTLSPIPWRRSSPSCAARSTATFSLN